MTMGWILPAVVTLWAIGSMISITRYIWTTLDTAHELFLFATGLATIKAILTGPLVFLLATGMLMVHIYNNFDPLGWAEECYDWTAGSINKLDISIYKRK